MAISGSDIVVKNYIQWSSFSEGQGEATLS